MLNVRGWIIHTRLLCFILHSKNMCVFLRFCFLDLKGVNQTLDQWIATFGKYKQLHMLAAFCSKDPAGVKRAMAAILKQSRGPQVPVISRAYKRHHHSPEIPRVLGAVCQKLETKTKYIFLIVSHDKPIILVVFINILQFFNLPWKINNPLNKWLKL